jgi:hypothetical protein
MAKLTAQYTWTAAEELALWKEARVYASQNKSYSIRGKSYNRQDLPLINKMISQLTAEVRSASQSSIVYSRHARR